MGRNSKQRRDAKRRKARGRSDRAGFGVGPPGIGPFGSPFEQAGPTRADQLALADLLVVREVRLLMGGALDNDVVDGRAKSLIRSAKPAPVSLVTEALDAVLARLLATVVESGWCPSDLGELVTRRVGAEHLPGLVSLLADDARRTTGLSPAWRAQLDTLGPATRAWADPLDGLTAGLRLAAVLAGLPDVPRTIPRISTSPLRHNTGRSDDGHRKLATVRALLAKAESSQYDEEAESLSAKAQELISRYALERLLASHDDTGGADPGVVARRLWLDAPYVMAKAMLVSEVALANRCRAVASEKLGFCTVIGDPGDLDAVELLSTSLLVQGSAAMVRHGRQVDHRGASRTRSFRHSFLVSYAVRIGERLARTAEEVVRSSEDVSRLLPVLRDQEARVSEAFDNLFPHVVEKETTVTNHQGWRAGMIAADQATLDFRTQVGSGAS